MRKKHFQINFDTTADRSNDIFTIIYFIHLGVFVTMKSKVYKRRMKKKKNEAKKLKQIKGRLHLCLTCDNKRKLTIPLN